ncbi:MAG: enoyl-CoA hydratase/isomerase family protein [Rhodoblastus sp.]
MPAVLTRENRDGAAILTLNRPDKLNALSVEMFTLLRAHVEDIARETETIGLVLLRGAGKCFCAGNDLNDIAAGNKPPKPSFQGETIEMLANLPQPVVTAVHGHCYTGGLELALAGDIIAASANAKFGDTHGRWALTPVWGMSQRLPRRVGAAKAKEMMFTSRTYSGAQAESMGLANFCFADDVFGTETDKLVREILGNSWFSHRANKKLIGESDGLPLSAGLAQETYRSEGRGPDAQARIAAFMNRK